ncbi:MAG: ABC transporter permease [Saprospiraceae bacterium]
MFSSYFKLALKVLSRKKFFTFISLFGISFTLMILMIITAFLDLELGDYQPLSERDRMLFVERVSTSMWVPDTTFVIDSQLVASVMQYDTTHDINENRVSMSSSDGAFRVFDQHLRNLSSVEAMTIFNSGPSFSIFKNGKKLEYDGVYSDAAYWQITDFTFLEGKPYGKQEVANQAQVVVMTEKAAREYFGSSDSYLNQEIELERKNFRVIGIIENTNTTHSTVDLDLFMPYTNMAAYQIEGDPMDLHGQFQAVFLAENEAALPNIKAEIKKIGENFVMPDPENYNRMEIVTYDFMEEYADDLIDAETAEESETYFWWGLITLLTLFILLPTLNLININISRIMERSAEIGVRKSFGADNGTILWQFVFENIILTIIGGVIGLLLAIGAIYLINDSGYLDDVIIHFNPIVFLYSLLVCLFFGVLSGIIPAYRMSQLKIVDSLKQAA